MKEFQMRIPHDFNVEERVTKAKENFKAGFNCCQSVILAFNDIAGMDDAAAATISSGFGGGMGRLREVCGSVSGMTLMAGFISPACNPSDKTERTANYALVQDFANKFKEINGSIVCRELLGLSVRKSESPEPSERTAEYYKKRPCEELVGISARIVAEKLQSLLRKEDEA